MEHNEMFKSIVALIKDIEQRVIACDENFKAIEEQGIFIN